jgi:solute:Na+ symporter, SSS family
MGRYLIWIAAYSAILVLLGAIFSRKVHRAADFLVAGRSLSPGLIFATLLAANIGAGTTVGATSLGYRFGWSAFWWVGSAALGCGILANSVAPRIWQLAHAHNLHTVGDFLEHRYDRRIRGCISSIIAVGAFGLLAAQLIALSLVFQIVLGVPHWVGAALGGIVMIAYFTAGGLLSSAWVNLFELAVLLGGFCLFVPYALDSSGGWAAVVRRVGENGASAHAPGYLSLTGIGVSGIFYYFALLTPSFIVSPGLIQKVYGARSAAAARIGVNANAIALALFAAMPPVLGIIVASRFPALADPQLALFKLMTDLLPAWLGILGLAAVFSAEVSTCDAVLFMLSTSITVDLYRTYFNPRASDRQILRVSRVSAVAAGLIGVLLSIRFPEIISSLTFFYSLVSVALFVPFMVGLYSTRPGARAALAAIGCSVPVTLAVHFLIGDSVLGLLNPFAIGMMVSFVVLWGATLMTERREATRRAAG